MRMTAPWRRWSTPRTTTPPWRRRSRWRLSSATWSSTTRSARPTPSTASASPSVPARSSDCSDPTARQDDHGRRAHHAGSSHRRVRRGGGHRRGARPGGAKRRLAVVPQRSNLDRALSARQILLFHAAYFGIPAASEPGEPTSCSRSSACRPRRRQGGLLLRRTVAADHDRARPDAPARGSLPRRADHGARPAGAALCVGPHPRPQGARRHHDPDHPRHG